MSVFMKIRKQEYPEENMNEKKRLKRRTNNNST